MDLPLNESRSSQRSGLGSGISYLVGAFGSKVIKCSAGSSLSTNLASREGDRGDPDFRSILFGGSTMRATTSSPLLVKEKASAQGLMKSQQLVRTRGAYSLPLNDEAESERRDLNPQPQPWQGYALPIKLFPPATQLHESARNQLIPEPFVLFYSRAISFLSVELCHPLEQLMLRIILTLQAALLSIFCRLSAYSADLSGFHSPGTACLFSTAITVSFPRSDYSIRSVV
nr:hypothetical protein [Tanacetum cinerariifolium]